MALDFLAGCAGGCAGIVVGYPLDTIKVHIQTQDYRNPKYTGIWNCFRTILAKESVAGLYRGMSSPIAGVALVNAIVFGVYGKAERVLLDPTVLPSHFIAGALAGMAQSPICSPMELAKTRMQLQGNSAQFSGPLACLRHTYRHEGFRGLCKGLGITFLRETPSFGTYFLTYEALTSSHGNTPVSTPYMFLAGGVSGVTSWVICYPLDVIKSRIQIDGSPYKGIIDCVKKSVQAEGFACLYRGLSSTIMRAFPTNAITFTVVTWTMRLFGDQEAVATAEKKSKMVASIREFSEVREPFLEKWNNFLAGASRSMMIHRLHYSTLSIMSTGNLQLGSFALHDRRPREGAKGGEHVRGGDKCGREESEEDCSEKKIERTVVEQTVNAVSMALA